MNFRSSSASERWTGGVPASWVGGRNGEGCEVWVRPKGFLKVFFTWYRESLVEKCCVFHGFFEKNAEQWVGKAKGPPFLIFFPKI